MKIKLRSVKSSVHIMRKGMGHTAVSATKKVQVGNDQAMVQQ